MTSEGAMVACECPAVRLVRHNASPANPLSLSFPLTFVFTICNLRVLEPGRSPAPTKATNDVQKSISTMEVAPSSVVQYEDSMEGVGRRAQTRQNS